MFHADIQHFPLVFGFSWGEVTFEDAERMLAAYGPLREANNPYCLISDARLISTPSAAVRKAMSDLAGRLDGLGPPPASSAVVLASTLMMGMAKAVGWFHNRNLVKHYVRSAESAYSHLLVDAAKASITLPDVPDYVRKVDESVAAGMAPTGLWAA